MSTPISTPAWQHLAALAACAPGGPQREIRSPIDGELIGVVPIGTAADVVAAAARARQAQRTWAARSITSRAAVAARFRDLVLERRQDLLDLVHRENGKSRLNAFEELMDTALTAGYYAQHAARHLATRRHGGAIPVLTGTVERYQPKGVVAIISPWNYPLTLAASDAIPALLAGNAVLLKPDSNTPFTALAVLNLLREAGLPDGVMQVVTGPGAVLGSVLIDHSDYLMFTGSTATGTDVARRCAERLIGCSAELGGKNAMLVLADADLNRAVEGAVQACFSTTGQLCVSIERIYVHEDIYDEFAARFAARTARIRLGGSPGWDVDLGPLISQGQLAIVSEQVADAVAHGATVLAGGKARPDIGPLFYEPTVLAGVTDQAVLARAETFGPVVSLYPVRSDVEAIALANDTDYGLNASVWSASISHARRVARQLRAGTVNINEGYAASWGSHDAPMGGMGVSGLGRRHGREGIVKYTEPQTISVQRLLQIGPPPGVSREAYAAVMVLGGRILHRVPVGLATRLVSRWRER